MVGLAAETSGLKAIMDNATNLKAHRTASSLWVRKGALAPDWSNKRWHEHLAAHCDRYEGARDRNLHVGRLGQRFRRCGSAVGQPAESGLVDRCSEKQGDTGWHSGRKSRKKAIRYDKRRYKHRNRIEIMFGRLEGCRRVAVRDDRFPETLFSAVTLEAIAILLQ